MDDKQLLENLLPELRVFFGDKRQHETKGAISIYEDRSHKNELPENSFFIVTLDKISISHYSNGELNIDMPLAKLSDFYLEGVRGFVSRVRNAMKEESSIITVNGKKYKLMEEAQDTQNEPF